MSSGDEYGSGFFVVDAGTSMADVLRLADELDAPRVVIRGAGEEDAYFVLELEGLWAGQDPGADLASLLESLPVRRADLVDAAGPWRHDLGGRPAVLLDQGIVTGVLPGAGPDEIGLQFRDPGVLTVAEPTVFMGGGPSVGSPDGDGESERAAMSVGVEYPAAVALGDTVSLLLSISLDATTGIPFVGQVGEKIDIVVSPKAGFVVEGRAETQLEVTGEAEPLAEQIKVRAIAEGTGRIKILAFRNGSSIGSLSIIAEVLPQGSDPAAATTASGALHRASAPAAELELLITEEAAEGDGSSLVFRLSSPDPALGLNLRKFGPVVLQQGPGPYFTTLYKEIEKLPLQTPEQRRAAAERLRRLGSTLFETLIPADLQMLLWELKDRIGTVFVQSDEPWVPWELCRLQGKVDGRVVAGPFFCEAFNLTRWIPGRALAPEVSLAEIGVIAPSDSGLAHAKAEADMVRALAGPGRAVADIPPDYVGVLGALAKGTYSVIHFVGHGSFPADQSRPERAAIELQDGGRLRPDDLSGEISNLGLARPLVFLNACQAGRQARGLTGAGGWATALVSAGVSAFVGAHWEVDDERALTFATAFYERLAAGSPVGVAAHAARMAIREEGDPTWLAYTVFALPDATVET